MFFFADYESEETRQGGRSLAAIRDGVRMEDVEFAYPNGHRALMGINLDLRRGELVALVGPTGAGKTTLAYLIPALLRPTKGRVFVDGVNANGIDLDSLRREVTYVFQEHLLLPESIRANLLLANPEASEERMLGRASHRRLHGFHRRVCPTASIRCSAVPGTPSRSVSNNACPLPVAWFAMPAC